MSCENGGFLIDDICICLNRFRGDRCEIPPSVPFVDLYQTKFVEQTTTTTTATTTKPSTTTTTQRTTTTSSPIVPQTTQTTSTVRLTTNRAPIKEENGDEVLEGIEQLILSRVKQFFKNPGGTNKNSKNTDDTMVWPWFECFPGDSQVIVKLENGDYKSKDMSELEVDDLVLTVDDSNTFEYSPIVTFLHKIKEIDAEFIRMHYNNTIESSNLYSTDKPKYITLTKGHLIYSSNQTSNRDLFEYKLAKEVNVGDYIEYVDEIDHSLKYVKVIKLESLNLTNSGIYAPLTKSGTLVVDNIHVSCFSLIKNHKLAQYVFSFVNKFSNLTTITSQFYHKYAKFLFNFLNSFSLKSFFSYKFIIIIIINIEFKYDKDEHHLK